MLLLTGGLSWAVKLGVNAFANDDHLSVDVHGFATGIFFGTRADSVVVQDSAGLRVVVRGIRIRGSLAGYFFESGIGTVHADSLGIVLPVPDPDPEAEPPPDMQPLFGSILDGFVTSTDTLRILRGRMADHQGIVILDSMSISAGVRTGFPAVLTVRSVTAALPELGMVSGSGVIQLQRDRVALRDFTGETRMGSLTLNGALDADSSLSIQGAGSFSTSSLPDFPDVTGLLFLSVTGTTGDPRGVLAISEGSACFMEREFSFTADSLAGSAEGAGLGTLRFTTPGISGILSGSIVFESGEWSGSVAVDLGGLDPGAWEPGAPSGDLTGTLRVFAEGVGDDLTGGTVEMALQGSTLEGFFIDALRLDAVFDPSRISGSLDVVFMGARADMTWSAALGDGYRPVSWNGTAGLRVPDAGRVVRALDPGSTLSGITGVSVNLAGRGTLQRFQLFCDARVAGAEIDQLKASGLFLRGNGAVDLSSGRGVRVDFNGTSGLAGLDAGGAALSGVTLDGNARLGFHERGAPSIRFTGTVNADSVSMADFTALESVMETDFTLAAGMPSGSVSFMTERIETSRGSMTLGFRGEARGGFVSIDSLSLIHEDGLSVAAGLSADLTGETVAIALDSVRVTMNKLRLVRAGGAGVRLMADGTVDVDTFWVDPPAGYLSGSARIDTDGSVSAAFDVRSLDIASLGLVLGLDLPVSGVLSSAFQATGVPGDNFEARLVANLDDPSYGQWTQGDSITVDAVLSRGVLTVDGIWIWSGDVRSGVRFSMDSLWTGTTLDMSPERLAWLEAELTGIGDWLIYMLPFPVMTSGASISSRIEYIRDQEYISMGLAGHFQRLFLAGAQMEFPMSSVYITYPDTRAEDDYNASFLITSGRGRDPALAAELRAKVRESIPLRAGELPLELEGYSFRAVLDGWETIISGVGWVSLSGSLTASETDPLRRPIIRGKIRVDQGVLALQGEQAAADPGGEAADGEIPMDLYIVVQADRGLWLRGSYLNIELAADITVLTQENRPVFTGSVTVVRGTISVLNRDFRITEGSVEIIQGTPPGFMLNILAETRVRSSMSREVYIIQVRVTGDPENPEIVLTGSGVAGELTTEDIVTLLTLGMTYGEMQQMDTGALESELESITQSVLGSMIARNIREGMGLDALSITPDLLSDSTGLMVEVGKYVLPDLYVSYTDDVFSPRPGTISAQYFFSRDIYLEGSTRTTLTGSQEPTLELHYTIRY